jgi:trans-aconitate methyltransferase
LGFFDTEEGVSEYLEMAKGHDGRELILRIREHLAPGSTVLELGMGPGTDLEILSAHYRVTGSDSSNLFLEIYRKINPEADLLLLDAVTIETDKRFDCIFSNKVLHHLERSDLETSVPRQAAVLEEDGLVAHSFWSGNKIEEHGGLHFVIPSEAVRSPSLSS